MPHVTLPVNNPETVLFAGDWHGNPRAGDAAITSAAARNIPVVIQLGDFGLWNGYHGDDYLDRLSAQAVRRNVQLLWLDGNHENFDLLATYPVDADSGLRPIRDNVTHLPRGSRWTWFGLQFAAVGGATSLDVSRRTPGRDWWPQEALTAAQAEAVAAEGTCDVLLCHDCPEGVQIPGIDRLTSLRMWPEPALRSAWAHREQLAELVTALSPTHLFHGHFHLRYTAVAELCNTHRTVVEGLGDDGTGTENRTIVHLPTLADQSAQLRAGI